MTRLESARGCLAKGAMYRFECLPSLEQFDPFRGQFGDLTREKVSLIGHRLYRASKARRLAPRALQFVRESLLFGKAVRKRLLALGNLALELLALEGVGLDVLPGFLQREQRFVPFGFEGCQLFFHLRKQRD